MEIQVPKVHKEIKVLKEALQQELPQETKELKVPKD